MEFMSYIILFGGLYCIYSFYKLRVKKDLDGAIVLPKSANIKDCSNKEEYIKKTSLLVLILGLALTIESIIDIYSTRTGNLQTLSTVSFFIVVAILVWVFIALNRYNKQYFSKSFKK